MMDHDHGSFLHPQNSQILIPEKRRDGVEARYDGRTIPYDWSGAA
jgi:hypothetical protein